MSEFNHIPVLLDECIEGLAIRPGGTYVDCTLGGAGHSSVILSRLSGEGRLIGIDRDADAIAHSVKRLTELGLPGKFEAVNANFHDIGQILGDRGIKGVDGILADLGVSSYQIDTPERGFSFRDEAPLDMRMDRSGGLSAADIVNTYSPEELIRILRDYGEEKWAVQIVRVICDRRKSSPILTTGQLVDAIDAAIPAKIRHREEGHPARRTFQAIRIAVNDELAPLEKALRDMAECLLPGGRLCVITFHSLEDRIVKNVFRDMADPCTCPKDFPICICGKKPIVRIVNRKPITASAQELEQNRRSHSASLRIVEKVDSK